MGDVRFDRLMDRLQGSPDVRQELDGLTDEEIIRALAAASKAKEPYWANVLATEAENRTLRLHALLDAFGDCVIRVNERGHVVSLGGSAERVLGWSTADMRGRDAHLLLHPTCSAPEHCPLARLARGIAAAPGLGGRFARIDGSMVDVGYRGFPIRREGEPQGAALFFWPAEDAPAARDRTRDGRPSEEERMGTTGRPRVHLTFYVAGGRPDSEVAAANLERLLERAGEAIDVSTVDVDKEPARAKAEHLVATPALVRSSSPSGERRVVGDLAETDRVVRALEIRLDPGTPDEREPRGRIP